jgi:predicted  nucleic acid-binding Zn-ribbon protein
MSDTLRNTERNNESFILDTDNDRENDNEFNYELFDEETRASRLFVPGYLYAFTSSWVPINTYKIGYTTNLADRLSQFSTSHLNARFVYTCPKLPDVNSPYDKQTNKPDYKITFVKSREQAVHKMLNAYRCLTNREFFECSLEEVKKAFEKVETMTEHELIAYNENIEYISSNSFEALKKEITELREEVKKLKEEIKDLRLIREVSDINNLRRILITQLDEINQLRNEKEQTNLNELELEIEKLKQDVEQSENEIARLQNELQQSQKNQSSHTNSKGYYKCIYKLSSSRDDYLPYSSKIEQTVNGVCLLVQHESTPTVECEAIRDRKRQVIIRFKDTIIPEEYDTESKKEEYLKEKMKKMTECITEVFSGLSIDVEFDEDESYYNISYD